MTELYIKAIENLKSNPLDGLQVLLRGLGELNPQVRDGLVYEELNSFIKSDNNNCEINYHLFNELLGQESLQLKGKAINQVLHRSFSALVLSNVIYQDSSRFFKLTPDELKKAFFIVEKYLIAEENLEDKHKDYGWIHCLAHGGDVLTTIMVHKNTNNDLAQNISRFILNFVKNPKLMNLGSSSKERFEGALAIGSALKKINNVYINSYCD